MGLLNQSSRHEKQKTPKTEKKAKEQKPPKTEKKAKEHSQKMNTIGDSFLVIGGKKYQKKKSVSLKRCLKVWKTQMVEETPFISEATGLKSI